MRMYQPELGRFFTQDRFAEKYLDNTPYHYALNNPVLFIDVNGDSTIYYNNNGDILHVSHDALENSAVIISEKNQKDFNKWVGLVTENLSDETDQANVLRKFGENYMIGDYEKFYDDNAGDTKDENGNENAVGLENEYGSFLYSNGQEVRVGEENIKGEPGSIHWGGENKRDDYVGKIHTHPNAGKRNAENTGTYDHGPGPYASDALDRIHSNSGNYRNVIVEPNSIYLYTKGKRDIIIPRNNTFQKK